MNVLKNEQKISNNSSKSRVVPVAHYLGVQLHISNNVDNKGNFRNSDYMI